MYAIISTWNRTNLHYNKATYIIVLIDFRSERIALQVKYPDQTIQKYTLYSFNLRDNNCVQNAKRCQYVIILY